MTTSNSKGYATSQNALKAANIKTRLTGIEYLIVETEDEKGFVLQAVEVKKEEKATNEFGCKHRDVELRKGAMTCVHCGEVQTPCEHNATELRYGKVVCLDCGSIVEDALPEPDAAPAKKAKKAKAASGSTGERQPGAVARVHAICDAMPDASRKDVAAACVKAGLQYGTARTQYQAWYAKNKKATVAAAE